MTAVEKNINYQRRTRGSESGVALLELVLVMMIFVVILVALVSLSVLSLSTAQKSRLRARGVAISEEGMENVRQKYIEEIASNNWTIGFKDDCEASVDSWAGSFDDEDGFFMRDVECIATDDKAEVTITVSWKFGKKALGYEVDLTTEFGSKEGGIFR